MSDRAIDEHLRHDHLPAGDVDLPGLDQMIADHDDTCADCLALHRRLDVVEAKLNLVRAERDRFERESDYWRRMAAVGAPHW